jgi:hypothetical protein
MRKVVSKEEEDNMGGGVRRSQSSHRQKLVGRLDNKSNIRLWWLIGIKLKPICLG